MSSCISRIGVLASVCLALLHGHAIAAVPRYTVTDLGSLSSPLSISFGYDLNDQGWVTGISYTDIGRRAFVWTPQDGMKDLGSLGGGQFESIGTRINNGGQVVGWSVINASYQTQSYVWSPQGGMQSLGPVTAYDINNSGTLAGSHVILPGQSPQALPDGFAAYALSDSGTLAGLKSVNGEHHAFTWDGTKLQDLGALPSAEAWSYAYDINAVGDVAGVSIFAPGSTHAVVWRGGQLVDLGDFAGGTNDSRAYGLNDAGIVVGFGTVASDIGLGRVHAALWDTDGTMHDLNDFLDGDSGMVLAEANAINESGQIVGWGLNKLRQTHAFLLSPVPESDTFVLFLAGVAALGVVRARCKD